MDSLTDRLRALALHQDLDVCAKAADRIDALEMGVAVTVRRRPQRAGVVRSDGHVRFRVYGTPGPQGSKSFKGYLPNGAARLVESSKKVKPWRAAVAAAATEAMRGYVHLGPVGVSITFYVRRPKDAKHRFLLWSQKNEDIDKLVRSTLDAMSGVAYLDDKQVAYLFAVKKLYTTEYNPEGADIAVWALQQPEI